MKSPPAARSAGIEFPPAPMNFRSRLEWGFMCLCPSVMLFFIYSKIIKGGTGISHWLGVCLLVFLLFGLLYALWQFQRSKIKNMRLAGGELILIFSTGNRWTLPLDGLAHVEPAPHVLDDADWLKDSGGCGVIGCLGLYHNAQFGFYSATTNRKNAVILKFAGDSDANIVVSPHDVPAFVEAVRQHIRKADTFK